MVSQILSSAGFVLEQRSLRTEVNHETLGSFGLIAVHLTLFRPGFFSTFWSRGRGGGEEEVSTM